MINNGSDKSVRRYTQDGKEEYTSSHVLIYDWLRLIATIFVVVGHSAYYVIQPANGGVSYELPQT